MASWTHIVWTNRASVSFDWVPVYKGLKLGGLRPPVPIGMQLNSLASASSAGARRPCLHFHMPPASPRSLPAGRRPSWSWGTCSTAETRAREVRGKSVRDVLYPAPFPPPLPKRLHDQSQDMMSAMGGAGPIQEDGKECFYSQQPVSLDPVSTQCPMSAHVTKYSIYHPSLLPPTVTDLRGYLSPPY